MSFLENAIALSHSEDAYYVLKNGLWYFYDETWSSLIGGYSTKQEARDALDKYCREFLGI